MTNSITYYVVSFILLLRLSKGSHFLSVWVSHLRRKSLIHTKGLLSVQGASSLPRGPLICTGASSLPRVPPICTGGLLFLEVL